MTYDKKILAKASMVVAGQGKKMRTPSGAYSAAAKAAIARLNATQAKAIAKAKAKAKAKK